MPSGFYKHSPLSKETRRKIAASLRDHKVSRETREKMSRSKMKDSVGYSGIHQWVVKQFGKAEALGCMFCAGTRGSKTIQWANLTGVYDRKPKNWTTLCVKCHKNYDLKFRLNGNHKTGIKTIELWQEKTYRRRMQKAHFGQIPWNKGKKKCK